MTDAPATPAPADDEDDFAPVPVLEVDEVPELTKPPFMVVGSTFFAQSEVGEIRFPLSIKTKQMREIPDDLLSFVSQLYFFRADDSKSELDKLDKLEWADTENIALKYFQAYREKQQASLGKFGRSSHS